MGVLKRFGQVVLLSMTCPRRYGIPMSSPSPCRRSQEKACVMTTLWKELRTGIIIIIFLKLLGCARASLPLIYLGKRGRKVRDWFPASIFLHRLSRGKLEGGQGSAEN